MNNKNLYIIIIVILLIVVVGGAIYFVLNKSETQTGTTGTTSQPTAVIPTSTPTPTPPTPVSTPLSEQPNQAKFNEYFTSANLAKLPVGQKFNPFSIVPTTVFLSSTDQFCTSLNIKKTIPKGSLAYAVYDTVNKDYINPKSVFPMEIKTGGSVGCQSLSQPVGKYEYKIYVDDVLAIVLPFEVK